MRKARENPTERSADLARLVSYTVSFLRHKFRVCIHPLGGPVFDLDHPNSWRANSNNVDFVGLELMGHGESEVRQQNPLVVARRGLQAARQMLEREQLALVGCRPTGEESYPHLLFLWLLKGSIMPGGPGS